MVVTRADIAALVGRRRTSSARGGDWAACRWAESGTAESVTVLSAVVSGSAAAVAIPDASSTVWPIVRSPMKTEELVSAVAACLREHALSSDRYDALTEQTGDNLGSLRGSPTGWGFDVNGLMVTVTAQTSDIRATAQDAFADALGLRDVLIAAAEVQTPRGELGVSSVHDENHAVTGWLGQVYLIFPSEVAGR
jgi:hypothetical protein